MTGALRLCGGGGEGRVYGLGSFEEGNEEKAVNDRGQTRGLKLDINWEGCEYSKCGRTDRGSVRLGRLLG